MSENNHQTEDFITEDNHHINDHHDFHEHDKTHEQKSETVHEEEFHQEPEQSNIIDSSSSHVEQHLHEQNDHHHHQTEDFITEDTKLQQQQEDNQFQPSAPPTDDNGYILVPPTPQSSIDVNVEKTYDSLANQGDDIEKILADLASTTEKKLEENEKIIAEADSSTEQKSDDNNTHQDSSSSSSSSSGQCKACPYYLLACNKLTKMELPPKVRDFILWKDPKVTGAIFGSVLVLLFSLANFSFFTVIGSLLLMLSFSAGAYRLYLSLLFRIKGTQDNTFEKLSKMDLTLPKDTVQKLIQLLEQDLNSALNKIKSALLWDNISNSVIAFIGFYVVYWVGSMFNILTLLILAHVSVFTLPKVYQVYKVQIDQVLEQITSQIHCAVKQITAKVPFLQHKKKLQ